MILNSLCEYYDILSNDKDVKISPIGYSAAKVGYAIVLDNNGQISGVLDLRGASSKKEGRKILVPEQAGRTSGVFPYFLCDKPEYVLGLNDKGLKKHKEFKKYHLDKLKNIDTPDARAMRAFCESYDATNAESVIKDIKDFNKDLLCVFLNSDDEYIHNDPEIKNIWDKIRLEWYECFSGTCLLNGKEEEKIAKKHPAIRNFGAQGQVYLTSFNATSYVSYGKTKDCSNAPISSNNAFKYTTILSYLLDLKNKQKIYLGDSTIVFWAQHPSPKYSEILNAFLNPSAKSETNKTDDEKTSDERSERTIKCVLNALKSGSNIQIDGEIIPSDTDFYILSLAPNNSRISVRFFHKNTFGNLITKIWQHNEDMEIIGQNNKGEKSLPLWLLLKETVHNGSKEKASSPLLAGKIFSAILTGSPYPSSLFSTIIERARTDPNISTVKASIIKACLIRKYRVTNNKLEEKITMSLNEELKEPAYLLGRLFAVLEQAQWKALGNINSGIKERFFASAASTPRRIFPQLLKNAQNHLAKSENPVWIEKKIGEIMADIDNFPMQLNLDDQGMFMLGYYHQRQALFTKKEENKEI